MAGNGGAREGAGRKPGKQSDERIWLARLARKHAEAAIKTLADCMNDKEAPHAARNDAAEKLLSRGFGKAPQEIILEDGTTDNAVAKPRGISELLGMARDVVGDGTEDAGEASSKD